MSSPVAIFGSKRCFCSSEPYFQIGYIASEPCTLTKLRRPLSPYSSSCEREAVGDGVHARAAVARERARRAGPSRAISGMRSVGELLLREELRGARQVALAHEAAHGVADHPLLLGEERVDGR